MISDLLRAFFGPLVRLLTRRPIISSVVILAVFASAGTGYVLWEFSNLTRFEDSIPTSNKTSGPVAAELPAVPAGVNRFLVFSTGSNGLDAEVDGERLGIGKGRARMADGLTDSILLVTLYPDLGRVGIVSIPRDTWLHWRGHRINESFNRYGVAALVDDVEQLTGLRVEHAVAMNFAAFADLTDALGGVRILFDAPARDPRAFLDIPTAGCVTLDGADALAFVRSRHWQVFRDGAWRNDATSSDWGRILRQQAFIRAAANQLLTWQLPARVPALLDIIRDNITFDQDLTVTTVAGLVRGFAANGASIEAMTFPGRGGTTPAGAAVIYPDLYGGALLVAQFDAKITGLPVRVVNPADYPTSALNTTQQNPADDTAELDPSDVDGTTTPATAPTMTPSMTPTTTTDMTSGQDRSSIPAPTGSPVVTSSPLPKTKNAPGATPQTTPQATATPRTTTTPRVTATPAAAPRWPSC